MAMASMKWPGFAVALLALALPLAAQSTGAAGIDPWKVLEDKIKAEGDVKLSGVREVQVRDNGRTIVLRQSIVRDTGDRYRIETVSPPTHQGILVVSSGVHRWRYDPRERIATSEELPLRAEEKAKRLQAMRDMKSGLSLELRDGGVVAARPAWMLALSSRDTNALLRQYWIDRKTSVELGKEQYGADGKLAQREWFVSVDYEPTLVGSEFAWSPPRNVLVRKLEQPIVELPMQDAHKRVGFQIFNPPPTALPLGFALIANKVAVFEEDDAKIAWLRFTNGIDILSLFERKRPLYMSPPRHTPLMSEWVAGPLHFTLVGQIRPADAYQLRAVTMQEMGSIGRAGQTTR
jgi:hypothetical protein